MSNKSHFLVKPGFSLLSPLVKYLTSVIMLALLFSNTVFKHLNFKILINVHNWELIFWKWTVSDTEIKKRWMP